MACLLSKSDFTTARSCHTKLYYKKKGYSETKSLDEFMRYLSEGGYMVGKLATLKYPEGIYIDTGEDHQKAIILTNEYLKKEKLDHRFDDGHVVFITTEEKALPKIIFDLSKLGIWMTDIEVKKPTLEHVFLQIARGEKYVFQ